MNKTFTAQTIEKYSNRFPIFLSIDIILFLIKKSMILMGTPVTISIVHHDAEYACEIIEEAFREFKRIEKIMNIYDEDSEVSRLNRQGLLDNASKDLIYVLKEAERVSRLTGGVYDVSILPLIEYLERECRKENSLTGEKLSDVLKLVDYSAISISGEKVRFLKKGMKIVLNSIAKGYAVDSSLEMLIKNGIKHALINAGGDIRAVGGKTSETPWRIAIKDPFDKSRYVCKLKLFNCAVATSGGYEYAAAKQNPYHILNPLKRSIAQRVVSATVIADKTIIADALATGLCAMEPSEGIELIEGLDNIEAMIVTDERRILITSGFRNYEDD